MEFPSDCASRFRPVRPLGAGGHGAVFAAEQVGLARPAAVKLLKVDAQSAPDLVRRFVDEAKITAALKHPSIVVVYDYGNAAGQPWIAYELIEGRTLREELAEGPLAPARALEAAIAIAAALECAHAAGVLHRDIKPDNVFALKSGGFKVGDFGIAKWRREGGVATQTGVLLATPHYVSPEQIEGHPASPASDLYALGAVLHELVTGAMPFTGEHLMAILDGHLKRPPPAASARCPGLPREVDDAIRRLLAKKPADRPASAAAARAELEACRGLLARTAARPGPAIAPAAPRAAVPRTALLAVALVVVAGLAMRPRPVPPVPTPSPVAAAAAWFPVRDVVAIASDRAAIVDFTLDEPHPVRLELRGPGGAVRAIPVGMSTWVHKPIADLAPDTEYLLDVVVDGSTRVLHGYRFRTRTERDARSFESIVEGLYAAGQGFGDHERGSIEAYPHPRLPAVLIRTIEQHSSDLSDMRPVPDHARRLRDRSLGQALLHALPAMTDPIWCGLAIEAIALSRAPETAQIASAGLTETARITDSRWYSGCARAMAVTRAPDAVARIAAARELHTNQRWAEPSVPQQMVRANPAQAAAQFERWLAIPREADSRYLRAFALTGLALIDDAPAVARLIELAGGAPDTYDVWARSIEALGGSGQPAAREALASVLATHQTSPPIGLLWAATRQGLPQVEPVLARTLADTRASPRRRAQAAGCLEFLGGTAGQAALEAALPRAVDPEERDAVLSALLARGTPAGVAAARDELPRADAIRADTLMIGLARQGDANARLRLRDRVDELASDPKLHELALVAFLHELNRVAPAEARLYLDRWVNDPRAPERLRHAAAIELDPRRAAARTVVVLRPGACFVRGGGRVARGDALHVLVGGRWNHVGHPATLPWDPAQLAHPVPARLALELRIGTHGQMLDRGDDYPIAPQDAELVWTPYGGEAFMNAGPLLMDETERRPPLHGRAIIVIDRPLEEP